MTEDDNILVFSDTLKRIKEEYPTDGIKVRYYNGIEDLGMPDCVTPITMVHGGTVNTGYSYSKDMRVAILNFADAMKFGGWVENGAQTQEENICRCTNIYPILGSRNSEIEYYAPNTEDVKNRLRTNRDKLVSEIYTDRIIYARDVTVFKDDTTYDSVEPRKFDVITCPAPKARLSPSEAVGIYVKRISQILLSAIKNDAECIVLGAWGCGAFAQNPELVACAFAVALNTYSGYFKKVVFAIKPTPQWGEKDLYDTFGNIFSRFYDGEVEYEK